MCIYFFSVLGVENSNPGLGTHECDSDSWQSVDPRAKPCPRGQPEGCDAGGDVWVAPRALET